MTHHSNGRSKLEIAEAAQIYTANPLATSQIDGLHGSKIAETAETTQTPTADALSLLAHPFTPEQNSRTQLPIEVLLHITKFALSADEPIIDPFSKLNPDMMTDAEKTRGSQVAIHVLATCKTLYVEGKRLLYANNSFVFTSVESLGNFAKLDLKYRQDIKAIKLRLNPTSRYCDELSHTHYIWGPDYHSSLGKGVLVEATLDGCGPGTMCQGAAWPQLFVFLSTLCAFSDPKNDQELGGRRMFPNLMSLRIDFINASDLWCFDVPAVEFHKLTSHLLGCSVDELIVTGLPVRARGFPWYRSSFISDLQGMVKEGGLFFRGTPHFVKLGSSLEPLPGYYSKMRVMTASNPLWRCKDESWPSQPKIPHVAVVPPEKDHPSSVHSNRKTVWKRVPATKASEDERRWVEFDSCDGDILVDQTRASLNDSNYTCGKCGATHKQEDSENDEDTEREYG